MRINNYAVYTIYPGYYFSGIKEEYHFRDPDYKIIKDNLTKTKAINFAAVMNKLKGTI